MLVYVIFSSNDRIAVKEKYIHSNNYITKDSDMFICIGLNGYVDKGDDYLWNMNLETTLNKFFTLNPKIIKRKMINLEITVKEK